jgi:hypothetical protein
MPLIRSLIRWMGVRWRVIDSVIDSVLAHVQNDLRHAQQIIDSAGK